MTYSRIIVLVLTTFFLLSSIAYAEINDCPDPDSVADNVMTSSVSRNAYKQAIIMGQITFKRHNFFCVNGLKIVPGNNMSVRVGNDTFRDLDALVAGSVVEIRAIPDPQQNVMHATNIDMQYTVAGSIYDGRIATRKPRILDEEIIFKPSLGPLCRDNEDMYIISGLRDETYDNKISALYLLFGNPSRKTGDAPLTRLTGILRKEARTDMLGVTSYDYKIGNTRIQLIQFDKLDPYIDKHVTVIGAWTPGKKGFYLSADSVHETPFTAVYNPATEPTYLSLQHYLGNKRASYTIYGLPIDTILAEKYLADHRRDDDKGRYLVVARGNLMPEAKSPTWQSLTVSGFINTEITQMRLQRRTSYSSGSCYTGQ